MIAYILEIIIRHTKVSQQITTLSGRSSIIEEVMSEGDDTKTLSHLSNTNNAMKPKYTGVPKMDGGNYQSTQYVDIAMPDIEVSTLCDGGANNRRSMLTYYIRNLFRTFSRVLVIFH